MATSSRAMLRLTALFILAVALAALCPKAARGQSADSADSDSVTSDSEGSTNSQTGAKGQTGANSQTGANGQTGASSQTDNTGDTGEKSAPPAAASSTDSGSAAKSDSSFKSDSPPADQYASHAALKTFDVPPPSGDPAFDQAAGTFPDFCKDWQRRLHDRELNNLENISWKDQNGWKTATYLSYSPVKTCNCKRSTGGVPIGELTYQETELYLSGRTVEEARHASPRPVGITNTTEIFRWNKSKWDDGM